MVLRFFSADSRPTYRMRVGLLAGRPAAGRNRVVSTPFGISSTRRASRDARAARSGVVAMTAAACLRPSRSTRPFSARFGPGWESCAYQKPYVVT